MGIALEFIKCPNYIKISEWKNGLSNSQSKFMITYKIPK